MHQNKDPQLEIHLKNFTKMLNSLLGCAAIGFGEESTTNYAWIRTRNSSSNFNISILDQSIVIQKHCNPSRLRTRQLSPENAEVETLEFQYETMTMQHKTTQINPEIRRISKSLTCIQERSSTLSAPMAEHCPVLRWYMQQYGWVPCVPEINITRFWVGFTSNSKRNEDTSSRSLDRVSEFESGERERESSI